MGMFLRRGAVSAGKKLGAIDVGTMIKLNESGSPVEFYIAKHNYEAGLNGDGRTLIVRKDCYDLRAFSSSYNTYANSSLDFWLCNPYLKLLDADIQSAIGTTKFYYTHGYGDYTVTTLQRAIFQLSITELGESASYAKTEGSALPIARTLQIAYRNGSAVAQWTRTPRTNYSDYACYLSDRGNVNYNYCGKSYGSRPTFTLPSDFIITDDMLAA